MSHLQPEITAKQYGWSAETRDAGTCFVPGDVVSVPDWIKPGVSIDGTDGDSEVFDWLVNLIGDYVEGLHVESVEVCRGYFARLSAPGYLDCTAWECHATLREARAALKD